MVSARCCCAIASLCVSGTSFVTRNQRDRERRGRQVKTRSGQKGPARSVSLCFGQRLMHRPARLSGSEQRDVAIARATADHPSPLLSGELASDVDTKKRRGFPLTTLSDSNFTRLVSRLRPIQKIVCKLPKN